MARNEQTYSELGGNSAQRVSLSVAKGPKFRLQNAKGTEKNCVGPGKSGAEFLADLSKKCRKGAELFCSLVLH
jgi:hypothetical protein